MDRPAHHASCQWQHSGALERQPGEPGPGLDPATDHLPSERFSALKAAFGLLGNRPCLHFTTLQACTTVGVWLPSRTDMLRRIVGLIRARLPPSQVEF